MYRNYPENLGGLGKIWGPVPPWPQPRTATGGSIFVYTHKCIHTIQANVAYYNRRKNRRHSKRDHASKRGVWVGLYHLIYMCELNANMTPTVTQCQNSGCRTVGITGVGIAGASRMTCCGITPLCVASHGKNSV